MGDKLNICWAGEMVLCPEETRCMRHPSTPPTDHGGRGRCVTTRYCRLSLQHIPAVNRAVNHWSEEHDVCTNKRGLRPKPITGQSQHSYRLWSGLVWPQLYRCRHLVPHYNSPHTHAIATQRQTTTLFTITTTLLTMSTYNSFFPGYIKMNSK